MYTVLQTEFICNQKDREFILSFLKCFESGAGIHSGEFTIENSMYILDLVNSNTFINLLVRDKLVCESNNQDTVNSKTSSHLSCENSTVNAMDWL